MSDGKSADGAGKLAVVFGGSGFIGRNVVRELGKRGWRVRAAVRRPHHAQFLRPMGAVGQIQLFQANVRHRPSVARALEGADAVVNLVGLLFQQGAQSFSRVQAAGAALIADCAKAAGVDTFIHMSAIGADPESDSLYARTKGEAERAVRASVPSATILRPSVVFGPEDQFFNKFASMASLVPPFLPLPILIGGGVTKFQPVYVDDVADAVAAALVKPEARGKTYELGGPRVYTFRQLLEFMLAETGLKRMLLPAPFAVAPALGLAGEVIGALPFLTPPITRDQVTLLKRDNIVAADALTLADLGLTPETLEAIVPRYLARFRKYGQFAERAA
ncbi:MAG TPA: complex I NDUFA9 subunit family protein [Parvularcula sp.]|nr:complex I NDUFA9 subunit family protein [Parvularcula sp.]HBS31673.1 complex I NDUFA9 subunit family protein [Parvularcula sp.]